MSETNAELTRDFLAHLQDARSDLTTRLDGIKDTPVVPEVLESVSRDVTKLRKELTEAIAFLPSYDQRQSELRLKEIETTLEILRASSAPKPRFSFKRTKTASTAQSLKTLAPTASSKSTTADNSISNGATLHSHARSFLTWTSLKNTAAASASDLSIADLDHCIVSLLPSEDENNRSFTITALHVRNIRNSVLLLPHVEGSALLHDMTRSVIALGCHQYRMHTSSATDVYLHVLSDPIIEHCSAIRFSRYPSALEHANNGSTKQSHHTSVKDFSHIRASPSPNWSILPDDQQNSNDGWIIVQDPAQNVEDILSKLLP